MSHDDAQISKHHHCTHRRSCLHRSLEKEAQEYQSP